MLCQYPRNLSVVITRIICAIMLHLSMRQEIEHGLYSMKYSLNHHYKFINSGYALYYIGLLRATMILTVELVNLMIILSSNNVLDVIFDFIALQIIADFDDIYYAALVDNPIKKLIEDDTRD
jgi:putative exporter of polyketide antibiotics